MCVRHAGARRHRRHPLLTLTALNGMGRYLVISRVHRRAGPVILAGTKGPLGLAGIWTAISARILALVGSLRSGSDNRRRAHVIAVGNDTIGVRSSRSVRYWPPGASAPAAAAT